jgi:hypothetical protein
MADLRGSHAEPAWHRRARRVRSGNRLLAQVTAACVQLAAHHGSDPPALLRPLLIALYPRPPHPRDVPWPSSLTSSSTGSPRVVIPMEELAVRGDLRPIPSGIPTSSSTLHTVVPVSSMTYSSPGDFRSLPGDYWHSISTRASWKYHRFSSSSSLPSMVLDDELRALAVLQVLAVVNPFVASMRLSCSSSSIDQVTASPDVLLRIATIFQALDNLVESISADASSWTSLSDANNYVERFKIRLAPFPLLLQTFFQSRV